MKTADWLTQTKPHTINYHSNPPKPTLPFRYSLQQQTKHSLCALPFFVPRHTNMASAANDVTTSAASATATAPTTTATTTTTSASASNAGSSNAPTMPSGHRVVLVHGGAWSMPDYFVESCTCMGTSHNRNTTCRAFGLRLTPPCVLLLLLLLLCQTLLEWRLQLSKVTRLVTTAAPPSTHPSTHTPVLCVLCSALSRMVVPCLCPTVLPPKVAPWPPTAAPCALSKLR